MHQEIHDLEKQLIALAPTKLPAHLVERLQVAVASCDMPMAEPTEPITDALRSSAPRALPHALSGRLEEILHRIPHPNTGKLVPFPESPRRSQATKRAQGTHFWRTFPAAAAVALLGALSAWFIPQTSPSDPLSQALAATAPLATSTAISPPTASSDFVVPAGFHSGLSEARDEGIVWRDSTGPQRMLKLIYRDHVSMLDSSGRRYEVERPRIKYILVPVKVD